MRNFIIALIFFFAVDVFPQQEARYDSVPDLQIDTEAISPARFDANFKSKYDDIEFSYEPVAHEKTLWQRFVEWLSGLFRNFFKGTSPEQSIKIVLTILKTLAVLIILFVIYLLVKALLNKEGSWIFGKNRNRKIIYDDVSEHNLQAADFEKLIAQTLEIQNLRLAVRYYYLWLLKRLSENGHIQLDTEKTNSDYANELQNPALKQEFSYLSYLYNYIWYGEFDIDSDTFERTRSAFESAIKSMR